MTIPLDDLLPTSDSGYTPPGNFADLFERGGAAWELADAWKWHIRKDDHSTHSFNLGYHACLFDICLKSGKPFMFNIPFNVPVVIDEFKARASQFGRTVRTSDGLASISLYVSEHKG